MNLIRSYYASKMAKQPPPHHQVSVISRNFCLRHSIDLLITKNIWQIGQGSLFVVRNSNNGKVMFKIEASIFSFDRKRVMFDAAGAPLVTLRKKAFSVVTTWQVYRGEGKKEKDLIFSVRRSSIFQMKTKLVVIKAKKKFEDVCDYTVQGSWFERSCEVYIEDSSTILAQMQKNSSVNSLFTGNDRFKVKVYPNVDCAFIVALIVILDEIVSETRRRSNINKRKH